jgi:phosphoglycolate phosphatase
LNATHFPYKHIIWDWNGTLLDDAWLCVEIINKVLQRRNLPEITENHYRRIFRFPVIQYYQQLGFDFRKESFEVVSTEFITEYDDRKYQCRLRENAVQTLAAFFERGVSQSLLSAAKHASLNDIIRHFGIDHYFREVSGLEDHHAFGKTENARRMIAEINCEAQEVLLVGDTVHDYEVAQEIGVNCCLIPGGHQEHQRLAACGVKMLTSLEELISF